MRKKLLKGIAAVIALGFVSLSNVACSDDSGNTTQTVAQQTPLIVGTWKLHAVNDLETDECGGKNSLQFKADNTGNGKIFITDEDGICYMVDEDNYQYNFDTESKTLIFNPGDDQSIATNVTVTETTLEYRQTFEEIGTQTFVWKRTQE